MQTRLKLYALLLCAAATTMTMQEAAAQSAESTLTPLSDAPAIQAIDALVNDQIRQWHAQGLSVSIVRDGKVLLTRGYGTRDTRTGASVTENTLFPTASLAKAFTALGVGILVDDGRMSFDGLVKSYIPGFEMNDRIATDEVTIRDLLSHRSGLRGVHDQVYFRNRQLSPAEFVMERLPHFDLHARPRQSYQYSNGAYVVIGQAMERAAGMPYERFMEERVFAPLGMTRTTFSASEAEADPNHATGRWFSDGQPVFEYSSFGRIINPHGGIISTATDMARWMILNLSGGQFDSRRIILASTLSEIHKTQISVTLNSGPGIFPLGYALGWNTDLYRGDLDVWHNGSIPGFRSVTNLFPGRGLGITILSNDETGLPDLLAMTISDLLLGHEPVDRLGPALAAKQARETAQAQRGSAAISPAPPPRPTAPPPSHPLADYSGSYHHPGYGTIRIRLTDDGLTADYNGHSAPLEHRHYDVFQGTPEQPTNLITARVQFMSNMDGLITRMAYERFGSAPFEKQPDWKLSDPTYLSNLAGVYDLGDTRITIRVAGNSLVYQRDLLEPATLLPALDGDFHHPRADLHFSFVGGDSGPATAMIRREGDDVIEMRRIG